MRWEYKRKYGRMPSEEDLKRVMSELYVSGIIRRDMERTGAMIGKDMGEGGENRWIRGWSRSSEG
jgi:hypothetical protein